MIEIFNPKGTSWKQIEHEVTGDRNQDVIDEADDFDFEAETPDDTLSLDTTE